MASEHQSRRLLGMVAAAQWVMEFRVMIPGHGKTPIKWLRDIGILSPKVLLGHAIQIDQHPRVNHYECRDIERLSKSGATDRRLFILSCASIVGVHCLFRLDVLRPRAQF